MKGDVTALIKELEEASRRSLYNGIPLTRKEQLTRFRATAETSFRDGGDEDYPSTTTAMIGSSSPVAKRRRRETSASTTTTGRRTWEEVSVSLERAGQKSRACSGHSFR
jgi:hypothetical protein